VRVDKDSFIETYGAFYLRGLNEANNGHASFVLVRHEPND